MRAQDNGHLTKQDRQTIHAQQNQESRRIYRDKHDGREPNEWPFHHATATVSPEQIPRVISHLGVT